MKAAPPMFYIGRDGPEWIRDLDTGESVFFAFSTREKARQFAEAIKKMTGNTSWVAVKLTEQVLKNYCKSERNRVALDASSHKPPFLCVAGFESVIEALKNNTEVEYYPLGEGKERKA